MSHLSPPPHQQTHTQDAAQFYAEHKGKPFYEGLIAHMSSAALLAMVLEKENAIADWRALIGPTNPDKARGEAESAELIGHAVRQNPGFMKLRRIDAARDIADIVANSGNKVYLNADSLLLNLLGDTDDKFEKSIKRGYF